MSLELQSNQPVHRFNHLIEHRKTLFPIFCWRIIETFNFHRIWLTTPTCRTIMQFNVLCYPFCYRTDHTTRVYHYVKITVAKFHKKVLWVTIFIYRIIGTLVTLWNYFNVIIFIRVCVTIVKLWSKMFLFPTRFAILTGCWTFVMKISVPLPSAVFTNAWRLHTFRSFPLPIMRKVPLEDALTRQTGSGLPTMDTIELYCALMFNWLRTPVSMEIAISRALVGVSVIFE